MNQNIFNSREGHLHLPRGLQVSDHLYTLHALGQLRVVDDAGFAAGLDGGPGLVHAVQVGRPAKVLSAVFRVDPAEVHRHVSKVVDRIESVLYEKKFDVRFYFILTEYIKCY